MNCNNLESLIALYVEGDLSMPDRRRIETHLQSCPACSDLTKDLRDSQSMFKSLRAGTVDASDLAGVRERVLNKVGDLETAPGWVVTVHRIFFAGLRRRNAIAGIAVAALVVGVTWYSHMRTIGVPSTVERSVAEPNAVARLDTRAEAVPQTPVLAQASTLPKTLPQTKVSRVARRAVKPAPVDAPPEIAFSPLIAESVPEPSLTLEVPMKFVTDNPDIIIYWLPADKGD